MEVPLRARILVQPAIPFAGALSRGREWDLSGFQATHPVPLPRSKTPAGPTNPCHNGLVNAAPANRTAHPRSVRFNFATNSVVSCHVPVLVRQRMYGLYHALDAF